MPAQPGSSPPVVVVGRGRVGRSLTAALQAAGGTATIEPGSGWRPRPGLSADALVLLAVPDRAIGELAAAVAASAEGPPRLAFVHLSGALGLAELAPLARRGHRVGSFHPLQPFPVERPPSAFRDSLVAIDASDGGLLTLLERVALLLGARPRRVRDEKRATYHAAASLAANMLVALADQSSLIFQASGWTAEDALDGVLSLMRGSLDALGSVGLPEALSGPIRRGDAGTVARHVSALESIAAAGERGRPLDVYRALGLAALDVAVRCGLEAGAAERVELALTANGEEET